MHSRLQRWSLPVLQRQPTHGQCFMQCQQLARGLLCEKPGTEQGHGDPRRGAVLPQGLQLRQDHVASILRLARAEALRGPPQLFPPLQKHGELCVQEIVWESFTEMYSSSNKMSTMTYPPP